MLAICPTTHIPKAALIRQQRDVIELEQTSKYPVIKKADREIECFVDGPDETPYCNGVWRITITLPLKYPFESPSIAFVTPILHPNVATCGAICLDTINQAWQPVNRLSRIINFVIPQLLREPNFDDPLNAAATRMFRQGPETYNMAVVQHTEQYAKSEKVLQEKSSKRRRL